MEAQTERTDRPKRVRVVTKEQQKKWYMNVKRNYTVMRIQNDELEDIKRIAARDGVTVARKIQEFITWGIEAEEAE